jgi:hypothetical protein
MSRRGTLAAWMLLASAVRPAAAQPPAVDAGSSRPAVDSRAQYPAFLIDSYFSVELGAIDYTFSTAQLQPGRSVGEIREPHAAARVGLFGHELGKYAALQVTYMRPVRYVTYTNVDGDLAAHHVFTHFGGFTVRGRAPVSARLALYGEGGLGVTSRRGFSVNGVAAMADAHYASAVVGGGVEYTLRPTWTFTGGATFTPGNDAQHEPHALLAAGGFRYTMRARSDEQVAATRRSPFAFAANLLQVEYSTGLGYGINTFLSRDVPVFWGGSVQVDRGLAVHYVRNVFHTARIFGLDFGASVSAWRSRADHDHVATLSAYPLFRFVPIRTRSADVYFAYSLAGPTFISRIVIDGMDTGRHFTFQDFMAGGVYLGRRKALALGVKINHYSNGNIFTRNAGLKIPLTITVGRAW